MCKLTVLHYSQCNCGPRDGSYEDGFIVTKGWHNRLLLDFDTVPLRRCTEARNFALCPSRSNTMEFPRCHDVQVKTVRFQAEPCFRCFTRREISIRTEKIKALNEQRKVFAERFDASQRAKIEDADFTKTMRQTIKASPQFDKRTEKQRFYGTKAELISMKFGSVKEMVPDWEEGLRRQLACRKLARERSTEMKAESASNEDKEQVEVKKQTKMALLQDRLAQVNMLAAFSVPVEREEPSATEQNAPNRDNSIQRLRVARPACKLALDVGLKLNVMVPFTTVQNMHKANSAQNASAPLKSSFAKAVTTQTQEHRISGNSPVKYHTINGRIAADAKPWAEDEKIGVESSSRPRSSSNQSLMIAAAAAPEFKPFQRPPPAEPRLMRAPTAPRAMREGSIRQTTWQPRQPCTSFRGYATYRTWRG
ncbi:uncharacterized protein EKO05_0009288 [Ascochyta rabiei]|uniref:uncharacterized protein n=1 Tax=Didymella rabiei TaxID=5454 RepID=UPI00220F148A|nr:uncharacterized protein EKO05_0009288 [Ascochyta rabiei]UPX19011.1 hypothetical protein EKO05_0009288 [Ascochyta rabiei]